MPSDSTIRVCHLIHDLRRGGAEHLLVDLATAAEAVGIDLTVVAAMRLEGDGYAAALEDAGVPVLSLNLASRWDPRGAMRLRRTLERNRPDVVHTHLKHADLLGARVAPRLGIPLVSTLHMIEDDVGTVGRFKRWAADRSRTRHVAVTVAVSDAVRDWYVAGSPTRAGSVVTLRSGVAAPLRLDAGSRAAVRSQWGVDDETPLAITLAVLRPGKGIGDLLEAAAMIGGDPGVFFIIAGSGPEERSLIARARELGVIGERVAFAGFVEDVASLLNAADLLVHPSHRDALPTAVIHGMAGGLPIVATNVGGTPEIVTEQVGVLVEAGEPDRLAAAIAALAGDPDRRAAMAEASVRRFEAEFSVDVWASRLRSLYDGVIEGAQ